MAKGEEIKFRFELNVRPNKDGLTEIFLIVADPIRRKIKTEVSVKNEHFGIFKDIVVQKKDPKQVKKFRELSPKGY